MSTIVTTELNRYKVIRTREQIDLQATDGIRQNQYKIRIKKDNKTIKNCYFSNKKDRNIAYRGFIRLITVGAVT